MLLLACSALLSAFRISMTVIIATLCSQSLSVIRASVIRASAGLHSVFDSGLYDSGLCRSSLCVQRYERFMDFHYYYYAMQSL